MIEEKIGKKGEGEITVYSLPYCNYCNLLKDTLDKLEIPYTDIDVDTNVLMGDWLEENQRKEILSSLKGDLLPLFEENKYEEGIEKVKSLIKDLEK